MHVERLLPDVSVGTVCSCGVHLELFMSIGNYSRSRRSQSSKDADASACSRKQVRKVGPKFSGETVAPSTTTLALPQHHDFPDEDLLLLRLRTSVDHGDAPS